MSAAEAFRDMHISKTCPKIGTEPISEGAEQIEIRGDPFMPGAYSPGMEFTGVEYDFPGGGISQIVRGETAGPIEFQGKTCLEVVETEFSKEGVALSRTRRIIYLSSRFAHTLLTHVRRNDGSGYMETTDIQVPLRVTSRVRWETAEFRRRPDGSFGSPIVSMQKVYGLYKVFIAKKAATCLRWCRQIVSPDTDFEETEETFIDVHTGLPMLLRHYVGPGWPNIQRFKRNPRMELNGVLYYLWFVRCLLWNAGANTEP